MVCYRIQALHQRSKPIKNYLHLNKGIRFWGITVENKVKGFDNSDANLILMEIKFSILFNKLMGKCYELFNK
jgi:hypothetical protein